MSLRQVIAMNPLATRGCAEGANEAAELPALGGACGECACGSSQPTDAASPSSAQPTDAASPSSTRPTDAASPSAAQAGAPPAAAWWPRRDSLQRALDEYVLAEEAKESLERANGNASGVSSEERAPMSGATLSRLRGSQPDCKDLLAGNRAWVDRMNREDPEFFKRLGQRQEPRYLYIGCSDARVDPSRLMGLDMGKLFVHRNIGNIVSGNDLNLLSVVDYAVNNLRVPHILVVGHYDCGAVRGSISEPEDGGLGIVENWLRNIRDVARFHREELLAIEDREQRHRRLVELNVQEQCLNILKIGTVQRKRLKTFVSESFALPRVHGLVFDPADGVLKKLPLDFKSLVKEDRVIYDLYRLPQAYQLDRRASS
jgi:carbonic anhydrase